MNENDEKSAKKKALRKEQNRRYFAKETPEKKAERLEKQRINRKEMLKNCSPEEKERLKELDRKRKHKYLLKKKKS